MSSLLIAVAMQVMACAIPAFHDYYLFSVYSRDLSTHFEERSNQNWAAYTNGEVTKFDYEALLGYAQRKGDKQMVNYVRLLNEYANGICEQLSDPWDYPTKEQMVKYKARLRAIKASAQTALRSRLRSQNALLVMRCNMILGLHQENIGFWNEWQQKLPNSVYRDMMRNIYAGALCHTGQQDKACEIFAEQGDMTSIRYCMYNNLSYEGIKKVYDQNINSPALPWLVQNYVNDAQTTLSEADNPYAPQPLVDSYRKGVNSFIKLANEAATKSRQPALWKAAAAWMEYMFGSRQKAQKYIDEAVKMEGTQRMKDNARAIRFYISSANARPGKAFDDYVAGELKWLRQKSKEDNPTQETWNYHYNEVAERTIFEVLADKYDQWQRPEIGIALFGYVDSHFGDVVGSQPDYEWNPHYSDYTFVRLDQKGPQAVERYLTFTKKKTDNELEQYLLRYIYRNEDYLNDLIGTKYISRMEWNKALDYLKKVPLTFLDGQNEEDPCDPDSASFVWSRHKEDFSYYDAGYLLRDLNQDGIPELIMTISQWAEDGTGVDLYTIRDGKIAHLSTSGERYWFMIREDGAVIEDGSGGALLHITDVYVIDGSQEMKLVQTLEIDGERDPQHPYFAGVDKEHLAGITEEEADAIIARDMQGAPFIPVPMQEYGVSPYSDLWEYDHSQ